MRAQALWICLLLACAEEEEAPPAFDPRSEALTAWKSDPIDLLAQCARQPFEELRITCLVQAAANLGRDGEAEKAYNICQGISTELWREECHFRAGEELGRAGRTIPALEHCADAGWFGRNCLTHTAWNLPRDPELNPSRAPEKIETAAMELLAGVDNALAGAGDGLEGEGHDLVMARFGYNIYVGSGLSDPAPAHIEGPLGVVLRTGFAIETARLLDPPREGNAHRPAAVTVEQILDVWAGRTEAPTGKNLEEGSRMGRYTTPVLSPLEAGSEYAPLFGGGLRLVGETPEEDLVIASLEALFWLPHTSAESFLPWTHDPRPRVRWTAARLSRLTPAVELDLEAALRELIDTHSDENVRWHAKDGLDHQTWAPVGKGER
jgi:hypothetical protein